MAEPLMECAANFSEGRDERVVDQIAGMIAAEPGVCLLHRTSDPDHHRSVLTFAGAPRCVLAAAVNAVGKAAELIDLNRHSGVHPRVGAADVVPFIPLRGLTLDQCVGFSVEAAEQIWHRWGVPVYLYEASARRPERKRLENIRRGQFEKLRNEANFDPSRAPDIGGPSLHPRAGAVVVGARKILIAYNVNLQTSDLSLAKLVAARIRESSGGLPHVKALGLKLQSRNQAQVSINLTDFELTPLHLVYEAVRQHLSELGLRVGSSELIGLIPRAALESAAAHYFRFENVDALSTIEAQLERCVLGPMEDLSAEALTHGTAFACSAAAAMACSLAIRVCAASGRDDRVFQEHKTFFGRAKPNERSERAERLYRDLQELTAPPGLLADLGCAKELASAARHVRIEEEC